MIYNIVLYPYRDTITRFLQKWGSSLKPYLQPLYYEDIPHQKQLAAGIYIFSDVERLTPAVLAQAIDLADRLKAAGNSVYNHPAYTLGRYDLLNNLWEAKINDFAVHRLADVQSGVRTPNYPVFLRRDNDHKGSMSQPAQNIEELEVFAKESLKSGIPLEDLIVVEWCPTDRPDGQFRKYSAFVIGDQFVARHVLFSNNWITKSPDIVNEANMAEEKLFIEASPHPHEALIREVFRRANLQYGRIDYGIKDGKIQVWEINSNPTIIPKHISEARLPTQIPIFESIGKSFRALENSFSPNDAKAVQLDQQWRQKHGISQMQHSIYPAIRSTRQLRKHAVRTFKRIPNRAQWLIKKLTRK
jgi:hypothetical protein